MVESLSRQSGGRAIHVDDRYAKHGSYASQLDHDVNFMSEKSEYHFNPNAGKNLPKVSSSARMWMRLHACLGTRHTAVMLRRALKLPANVEFQPGFRCTGGRLEFKGPASLGDTFFVDYAPVIIGLNVSISFRNMIITSTHVQGDFDQVIAKPVVIEDDVWITSGVIVLGGVTIGRGSVIGAGSVVTKSIPANSLAAGNPCRVIRRVSDTDLRNTSM